MSASSKRRLAKRFVPLALLAVISIAAWLVPSALGASSSVDAIVIVAWLAVMALLLFDSYRRDHKRTQFLNTFYVDAKNHRMFSPSSGLISYPNGAYLIDVMAIALVNESGAQHVEPPADFVPTCVVETSEFAYVRDPRINASAPISRADDVTITQWEGVICDLSTDKEKAFASPFDLEDVFNPCMGCTASGGQTSRTMGDAFQSMQFQSSDSVYAMTKRM